MKSMLTLRILEVEGGDKSLLSEPFYSNEYERCGYKQYLEFYEKCKEKLKGIKVEYAIMVKEKQGRREEPVLIYDLSFEDSPLKYKVGKSWRSL